MRLIGHIDGVEISFDFYPPNIFRAIIPKKKNGTYIVDLKAIDEAGNIDYTSNICVCIDFQSMSFKILENKYCFNIKQEDIDSIEIKDDYFALQLESNLVYEVVTSSYSYRELVI